MALSLSHREDLAEINTIRCHRNIRFQGGKSFRDSSAFPFARRGQSPVGFSGQSQCPARHSSSPSRVSVLLQEAGLPESCGPLALPAFGSCGFADFLVSSLALDGVRSGPLLLSASIQNNPGRQKSTKFASFSECRVSRCLPKLVDSVLSCERLAFDSFVVLGLKVLAWKVEARPCACWPVKRHETEVDCSPQGERAAQGSRAPLLISV